MLKRPKILQVIPRNDFTLDIQLSDNRELKLDMKPLIEAPFYQRLSNLGLFLSIKHDNRLIYWNDMLDMHIDQILKFSVEV